MAFLFSEHTIFLPNSLTLHIVQASSSGLLFWGFFFSFSFVLASLNGLSIARSRRISAFIILVLEEMILNKVWIPLVLWMGLVLLCKRFLCCSKEYYWVCWSYHLFLGWFFWGMFLATSAMVHITASKVFCFKKTARPKCLKASLQIPASGIFSSWRCLQILLTVLFSQYKLIKQ